MGVDEEFFEVIGAKVDKTENVLGGFDEKEEESGVEKVGLLFGEVDDGVDRADAENGEDYSGVDPA